MVASMADVSTDGDGPRGGVMGWTAMAGLALLLVAAALVVRAMFQAPIPTTRLRR
ncbi:MAG: hypothetical protein ABIP77_01475 [Candidatus Limnocylindrales bacterium]